MLFWHSIKLKKDHWRKKSMRGKYMFRRVPLSEVMFFIDTVLNLLFKLRGNVSIPLHPQKILIANWAHAGDVIITFGLTRAIRELYPNAQIDMLVGSWGSEVAKVSGLVDRVHIVDHWMLNRSNTCWFNKVRHYFTTRKVALCNIRSEKYDIAINAYPFFPTVNFFFYLASIFCRIGFSSCGFWPFLTHHIDWLDEDRFMSDYNRDILRVLNAKRFQQPGDLQPALNKHDFLHLPHTINLESKYIVIHPGAGSTTRDWGDNNWRVLLELFQQDAELASYKVVITGAGSRETSIVSRVLGSTEGVTNLAGQTNWNDFLSILAHASLIVCPDTAAAHAGALFEIPTVCLFTGTNNPKQWGAANPKATIITYATPCAPCYRKGCDNMVCIKNISPKVVFFEAKRIINALPTTSKVTG